MSAAPTKPDEPKSLIDKAGAALPIALTALATVFASMSNGALQEAMYWKSQAAQDQAKVTNQWTHAGFKRDRALTMEAAAAQLRAAVGYAPPAFDASKGESDADKQARAWLAGANAFPPVPLPDLDPDLQALRDAIKAREPERDVVKRAGHVDMAKISKAIDDAERAKEQTDAGRDPAVKAAAALVRARTGAAGSPDAAKAATAAQAAGFDLEERRYRAESRAEQDIGYLYEIRTKVSAAVSDKYRQKSDYLSYAMLVAQVGAVAASLALARKQRNVLWLFAALVGVAAVSVGGYALVPAGLLAF